MNRPTALDQVLELTGLPASSPMGFMAAIGLLRVCARDHRQAVALSWNDSHARLHGMARADLVELLCGHMRGRWSAPEFNFQVTDDKGRRSTVGHLRQIRPADFRNAAEAMRDDARAASFLAGFGTDAVVNDEGFIARSRLDFSSGQQQFMDGIRKLGKSLDPDARRPAVPLTARIERSLFGGPYEEQHTFGWDPASLKVHAHQPEAPTDSATPGQPMTVWLAVEALPLHPVIPIAPRRAATAGVGAGKGYVWPLWSAALGIDAVELVRQRPVQTLDQLPGVTAIWMAAFTSVGKYTFMLPGARTPSDARLRGGFAPHKMLVESRG